MDKRIEDLEIVHQVFDKHKAHFFVGYGALLGWYRDGMWLPGDDDIDIGCIEPLDLKTRKSIGWMLYDLGFKPQSIGFNVFGRMEPAEMGYNGDMDSGVIVCEKNIKFTIFFFNKEMCKIHKEEYVCTPKLGALKLIATPTKFYKKLDKVSIGKKEYLTPSPIEDYLKFSYEDWKDPMKRDHSKTFFEAHPEQIEMIKDVEKKNQVVQWKK